MLTNVHVRNYALLREAELELKDGLNVITGETGAGKSLLLGSLTLALGGRLSSENATSSSGDTLAELIFTEISPAAKAVLEELGIDADTDEIIIARKISSGRSTCRINGESVTLSAVKKLAPCLLDIHGQFENQTLLNQTKQLEVIDSCGNEMLAVAKEQVSKAFSVYRELFEKAKTFNLDEKERLREISLLEYEINEIESAALRNGEEDELEQRYKMMVNAKSIAESLGNVYSLMGLDGGASEMAGRACREIAQVENLSPELSDISSTLTDVDTLINDLLREVRNYLNETSFSDAEFFETEERLDLIRNMQAKYGKNLSDIEAYAENAKNRLSQLSDYENARKETNERLEAAKGVLQKKSQNLSEIRKKEACKFEKELVKELSELNFEHVSFEVKFDKTADFTKDGFDKVTFMISLNKGEPLLPLSNVASGGELSRIMLAIRTIMADGDGTDTLVFDEIDSGISGRTAQRVSEKMALIAKKRQVICVTHLAQIAAMADSHFLISKHTEDSGVVTEVCELSYHDMVDELARILGGARITDVVRENAEEMKRLAEEYKAEIL